MKNITKYNSIILALGLLGIIAMMIFPTTSTLVDIGLVISFALALLIFVMVLFIEHPLDFSSFPTLLLGSLMLRLALNVSSTKLIIGQGHTGSSAAGNVIDGFAQFVMSGNFVIGLVTFLVILIVNFLVITKGAARMAEVGARFALDGMPGKQLAIDSDVSSGAIDHKTAKFRRDRDQKETTFLGSLDGVSKFVKGDAVAGLLITAVNFLVGLAYGVIAHDIDLSVASQTYAILTVGDGLVTQIPAVIVSIASALLLSKGSNSGSVDIELFGQIGKHPTALFVVAALLFFFAVLPGLPVLPFLLGCVAFNYAGYLSYKSSNLKESNPTEVDQQKELKTDSLGDVLALDEIHLEFSTDLVDLVLDNVSGLNNRIANMRKHIAVTYGFVVPEIRLTDNAALSPGLYVIKIHGVEKARGQLNADLVLALVHENLDDIPEGLDVSEPVYSAPARWISPQDSARLVTEGITLVTPTEVVATHLLEIIKQNLSRLFSYKSLKYLLHEFTNLSDREKSEANQKFLDETIPDRLPLDLLHRVLRCLLDEQVSIRNLQVILESIAEVRNYSSQPEAISEIVRQRLGAQIVSMLKREDGSVPLIQLAPEWEEIFSTYQIETDQKGIDVALPPEMFSKLTNSMSDQIAHTTQLGLVAPIITSSSRRRFIKKIAQASGLFVQVLSFEELGLDARPTLVGTIST